MAKDFDPDAYLASKSSTFDPDAYLASKKVETPAPEPVQSPPSILERMFGLGSPIARVAKGAIIDPLLGVNQKLAQVFPQAIREGANANVNAYEQATQEARSRVGSEGFDWAQLTGNVLSPANKLLGATQPITAGLLPAAKAAVQTGAATAAIQPVIGSSDVASKTLEQMGVGALFGGLTSGAVAGLGKFMEISKGLTAAGREQAMRDYLKDLSGGDKTTVVEALRNAKELVTGSKPTVAEALSNIPTAAELVAAQAKIAGKQGVAGKFAERGAEQQAARVRSLQGIAGTEAERAALTAERGTVTGAMREGALDINEIARTTLGNIDKQVNTTAGNLIKQVKEGLPTLQQTSPAFKISTEELMSTSKDVASSLKKAQLDSLEQNGVFPLLSADITKQIDKVLKGTISDTSRTVLQAVKDKIIAKTDENGIIGSRDLYENVRKMSNQDISKLLGLGDQYASGGIPEQAAKALGNVKKFVDSSLDKSTDGLWTKYLTSYKDYSNKLNRMEVGDYLSKRLQTPLDKERAGVFSSAVENAAGTIKKSTGIPRYNSLDQVLTPSEVGAVNSVMGDLMRKSKADELAGKVGALTDGLPNPASEVPNLLSRTVALAKAAVEHMRRGDVVAYNNKMAELMLEPAAMAQFMTEGVKKGKVADFTSSLMKIMDEPTKRAFIQSFTVPQMAQEVGSSQ